MSDLLTLIDRCLAERKAFRTRNETSSPACIEIFRLAFAGDQAAWEAIFAQIVKREIRSFVEAAGRVRLFDPREVEDAIQQTQISFWRYAPKTPTLAQVRDLAPIIAYLKRCAMSAVASIARKLPPDSYSLSALRGEEPDESDVALPSARSVSLPTQPSFTDELDSLLEYREEMGKIIGLPLEELVVQEIFINEKPPREFVEDHWDELKGNTKEVKLEHVNQVLQNVRRRLKKMPYFQNLLSSRRKSSDSALLQFRMENESETNETRMSNQEPCPFDEASLLDYVRGVASDDTRLAIERSPVCVEAARQLADDLQVLVPLFRMALCPDVNMLIDYYHKRLPSAQQLVVHNHVQGCQQCQAEIAMFAAIDEVAVQEQASFFRRVIEAVFVSPTLSASPTRGGGLLYRTQIRTPQIDILIRSSTATGKPRRWTVRIDLRDEEGLRFTEVEQLLLQKTDEMAADPMAAVQDEDKTFVVRGLEAGSYRLQVLTSEEEILVRQIVIGEQL